MIKRALFNWSGGKDSAFALGEILEKREFEIPFLLTSIDEDNRRVSMHGVHEDLMIEQANAVGIPIRFLELPELKDMETYENRMTEFMNLLKEEGIRYSIFGDINLDDLRKYRENQLKKVGFESIFPLWKMDTLTLVYDFLDQGFKSIITAADAHKLPKEFVGEIITKELIKALPEDVDPCGENGEFHSFVFDAPYFKHALSIQKEEAVLREYQVNDPGLSSSFWFCPISLNQSSL